MLLLAAFACVTLAVLAGFFWSRQVALKREAYIRSFEFPRGLFDRLRKQRPQLELRDCQLVAHGLRQFFLSHLKSGRRYVSMPSQVADELWHEFILYTKNYQQFCDKAFGRFLHHTPAVALGSERLANAGLRRCFWHTCKDENINPRSPARLPLLFALDNKLKIADGFTYYPSCGPLRRKAQEEGGAPIYCGGDFSDGSFEGGTAGFGDDSSDAGSSSSDGGSSDGGSDGGSCGGGGCGGGGGD